MAEPFGIAAGAIGIAAAFSACVDCFGYIRLSRSFGSDFQTYTLALNGLRLRLTRWGAAVNVTQDPRLSRPDATPAELQMGKQMLMQMLETFQESKRVAQKYVAVAASRSRAAGAHRTFDHDDAHQEGTMDALAAATSRKLTLLSTARQKKAAFLRITAWSLYQRNEYKDLVDKLSLLLAQLEALFPPVLALQAQLVQQELAPFTEPKELQLVAEAAAHGRDEVLRKSSADKARGHSYRQVAITDRGRGLLGDEVADDYTGQFLETANSYDGVKVDKEGKGLMGTKYGGKGFLDD